MGINFDELKNKAEELVKQHGDKIEQGVEKAGDFAKQKFGHGQQVDSVVDKIQDLIPDRPQQGAEPKPGEA
jgi:MT0933-like antitoxin protein